MNSNIYLNKPTIRRKSITLDCLLKCTQKIFLAKQIKIGKAIKVTSGNSLTICCFGPFLSGLKV